MLRGISNNLRNSNHLLRRHIRSTNNAILTPFNNDNNSSNQQQQVRHMALQKSQWAKKNNYYCNLLNIENNNTKNNNSHKKRIKNRNEKMNSNNNICKTITYFNRQNFSSSTKKFITEELGGSSLLRSAVSSMSLDDAFIDVSTVKGELTESESIKEILHMTSQTKTKSAPTMISGEEHVDKVDPFKIVASDIRRLNKSIKDLLGSDHPVLDTVAQYFFDVEGGKKIRPAMILLVSRATNIDGGLKSGAENAMDMGVTNSQIRLAEVTEMIHTASLLHDDVIDLADTRRGIASVNSSFGNKLAVLAGDFLLARSSVCLARLRNVEAIELLANVIEHLVKGEVMQMKNLINNPDINAFDYYMRKNFYKTGSLMANSCRAAAVLEGHSLEVQNAVFDYGRGVGAAFQLVDDMLDFTSSEAELGKPVLNDLKSGLTTAPTLFACDEYPKMLSLAARKYESSGDVEEAFEYVRKSNGLERTKDLAMQYSNLAVEAALKLEKSPARDAMIQLARQVVRRSV